MGVECFFNTKHRTSEEFLVSCLDNALSVAEQKLTITEVPQHKLHILILFFPYLTVSFLLPIATGYHFL